MKKVVLIGDSIRMGYQSYVQKELRSIADVWGPEENGGTSKNILLHLDKWVLKRAPDIVHLNCGLHDLKKKFGSSDPAISLEAYEFNLRKIFSQILEEGIHLIWTTITPVDEVWHHQEKGFDRFEVDVAAYNAVASKVANEYQLPINDLFALITEVGLKKYLTTDGVHFVPEGSEFLGKAVAKTIKNYIR